MGNARAAGMLETSLGAQKLKGEKLDFARQIVLGSLEKRQEIDALIAQNLRNWKLENLGQVEKAVLRLAIYEILYTATDIAVIINEALEITKEFADEQAPSLINAILDKIKRPS